MIQIYHGDGKGKTTAAIGISVRARGHNIPVVFAQFLKDGSSGEIKMLEQLGVTVMLPNAFFGFVRSMNEEQLRRTKADYAQFLQSVKEAVVSLIQGAKEGSRSTSKTNAVSCVLVMDEVLHACNNGLLDERQLLEFMEEIKEDTEVILTGRNPSDGLVAITDYCTNFTKEKHPFDQGVVARTGVEM